MPEPTPSPSPSDAITASAGGHRPGDSTGGGSTSGTIVDPRSARSEDPTRGGAVLSSTGLPATVGGHDGGPGDLLGSVIGSIAAGLGPTVQPAAVAAVATTFGFPLALMLAVLLFLVIQSRLDGRDPKLRAAPLTAKDTYLPFDESGR